MTPVEFNKKWEKYLEPRFYGLDIYNEKVIEYLDSEFEKEIKVNPDFQYSQIKLKFDNAIVYANTTKNFEWERMIDKILN